MVATFCRIPIQTYFENYHRNRSIFRNATVVSVTFLLPQKSAHFWTVTLRCRAIPPLQYKDIAQFTDPIFGPQLCNCVVSVPSQKLVPNSRFLVFKRHNPLACPTSVCNSQFPLTCRTLLTTLSMLHNHYSVMGSVKSVGLRRLADE